jgi:hypothetical protein
MASFCHNEYQPLGGYGSFPCESLSRILLMAMVTGHGRYGPRTQAIPSFQYGELSRVTRPLKPISGMRHYMLFLPIMPLSYKKYTILYLLGTVCGVNHACER